VLAKNNLKMALKEVYLYISVGLTIGFLQRYLAPEWSARSLMNEVHSLWLSPPMLSCAIFSNEQIHSVKLSVLPDFT
jgi:hypothetical protein